MARPTAHPRAPSGSGARARHPSRCTCDIRRGVVAPMQCSSPRASAGFSMLPASMAPSALPAPTIVCSSSMKRMMRPSGHVLQHRLQTLLELATILLAPAAARPCRAPAPSLPFSVSGTSSLTIRCARPSTMASCRRPARRSAPGCSWCDAAGSGWRADFVVTADHWIEFAQPRARSVRSIQYFFNDSRCPSAS